MSRKHYFQYLFMIMVLFSFPCQLIIFGGASSFNWKWKYFFCRNLIQHFLAIKKIRIVINKEQWKSNYGKKSRFPNLFLLWEMDKITKTDILNMEIVQKGNWHLVSIRRFSSHMHCTTFIIIIEVLLCHKL